MSQEVSTNPHVPLNAGDFLHEPQALRETLEARGALNFRPYPSGLFPASELPAGLGEATGMDMAWLRDNAHVIYSLYMSGRHDLAIPAGQAVLTVLHNNRDVLDVVVSGDDPTRRLPVRVNGNTLENDTEPRVQNDSTGYALWLTSLMMRQGDLPSEPGHIETLAQTVRYLSAIEYWRDPDEGHWEEDQRIHASSIGVDIAALREAQALFAQVGYPIDVDIEDLVAKGKASLRAILAQGVTDLPPPDMPEEASEALYPETVNAHDLVAAHFGQFSTHRRQYDAALLFLIEPLRVLEPELAAQVVHNIETHLRRDTGVARYQGDTYWEPRFTDIMGLGERTTAGEGKIERRNLTAAGVAYTGTEAQWTLFDPLLSAYWGGQYTQSGNPEHREKQLLYLNRSLAQLVPQADGTYKWPEAFYYEWADGRDQWIPNEHTPLLWTQGNVLHALRVFERTSQATL